VRISPLFKGTSRAVPDRHDLPSYRVDAGVSDLATVYDYNFNDEGVNTRDGPMLEFACGAGDASLR
jgi:hypothetical protein